MDNVPLLEDIRTLIRQTLERHGARPEQPTVEAMLIQNGFFCGRRFTIGRFHAVWFLEENEVKFYGPDGALLEARTLTVDPLGERRAA